MTQRRWTTAFILSFVPLGIWLMVWFFQIIRTGGLERGGPALAFIIPTTLYVCFQIWLAIRAFF